MSNLWEDTARRAKALKLARWLHDTLVEQAELLNDEGWENCAAKAGVNPPSDKRYRGASPETRAMVLDLLKARRP